MKDRRGIDDDDASDRNADVFDDEFALDVAEDDFMPSVSDGFRPQNHEYGYGTDQYGLNQTTQQAPSMIHDDISDSSRHVNIRNSTAKMRCEADDSADGTACRSMPSFLQHRASVDSNASFATMTVANNPFESGPSHPYGMYPQDTTARLSGIATSITTPRHPQLLRPSHPYGLYPQNIVEEEPPASQVQAAIPVGFSNLNATFRRQLGPDGEEQDIIGFDGHAEQLPPYSRYPIEGPTKASREAEASAAQTETSLVSEPSDPPDDASIRVSSVSSTTQITSSTMPVPSEVASVVPARLPQQRPETQTGDTAAPRPATTSESASLLTSEGGASEKPSVHRDKKYGKRHRKTKRRWGGVPRSLALLVLLLILVFAAVLGAAIGTYMAKKSKIANGIRAQLSSTNETSSQSRSKTKGSLFDATPITSSVHLPLPTGEFWLPMGYAQESSPNCLLQDDEKEAWSCQMGFPPLRLTVKSSADSGHPTKASLSSTPAAEGTLLWGLQPPNISDAILELVIDLDANDYGPAWHFDTTYDKVVILTPEELATGDSVSKRQSGHFRSRFNLRPGDALWYCTWNETYIEVYIYAEDDSTPASLVSQPSSTLPAESLATEGVQTETASSAEAPHIPIPTTIPKRDAGIHSLPNSGRLPLYPLIVKIEERRLPGAPPPSCQKMEMLDDRRLVPTTSWDSQANVVLLQEDSPSFEEFNTHHLHLTSRSRNRSLEKRTDPIGACHCQWVFQ